MTARLFQGLRWFFLAILVLIAACYLILAIAMKYTAAGGGLPEQTPDAIYAESTAPHSLKLIDTGMTSLYERLKLIESAKSSIELEFFIFNIDQAARLVTNALLQKAKDGVHIRLLVDFSAPVFQLRPA